MSTVSSVGGYGENLLQMLQQMKLQQTESSSSSSGAASVTSRLAEGLSGGNRAQKFDEQLSAFAEEAGLDEETVAALQEDVRSAISSAMEEAEGSSDHREQVKNAVSATLTSYGLDAEAFDAEMKKNAPPPPPDGGMSMMSANSATGEESDSTSAMSQLLSMLNGNSDSSGLLANLSLLDSLA